MVTDVNSNTLQGGEEYDEKDSVLDEDQASQDRQEMFLFLSDMPFFQRLQHGRKLITG